MADRRVDPGPLRCLGCGYVFPEPVFEPRWDDARKLVVCFSCDPPTCWCHECAAGHPNHEEGAGDG